MTPIREAAKKEGRGSDDQVRQDAGKSRRERERIVELTRLPVRPLPHPLQRNFPRLHRLQRSIWNHQPTSTFLRKHMMHHAVLPRRRLEEIGPNVVPIGKTVESSVDHGGRYERGSEIYTRVYGDHSLRRTELGESARFGELVVVGVL